MTDHQVYELSIASFSQTGNCHRHCGEFRCSVGALIDVCLERLIYLPAEEIALAEIESL